MEESSRQASFVPVLGMPTSVLKYGSLPKKTPGSSRYLFLIIPGNPGVAEFYDEFMERLFTLSDKRVPVWSISHAGHVRIPEDGKAELYEKISHDVCTLEGQIKHKVTFIKDHVPSDVKLILIGHSIGCYMILKMLDELDKHRVQRCFMLFPTIERMSISPNGLVYTPMLKYFRWMAVIFAFFVTFLPDSFKKKLIKWHFGNNPTPHCMIPATLSLLHPFSVGNAFYMAHIEMQTVNELDEDLVKRHLPVLSFYYGSKDQWCPLQYYRDFKELFPSADLRLCDNGYSHAYVIDASVEMAEVVWDWIKPQIES